MKSYGFLAGAWVGAAYADVLHGTSLLDSGARLLLHLALTGLALLALYITGRIAAASQESLA